MQKKALLFVTLWDIAKNGKELLLLLALDRSCRQIAI
jgi:hypothetical protein